MDTKQSQPQQIPSVQKNEQWYMYPPPPPYPYPQNDPDEINLLEYIYVLVKNKWWIIGATIFGLVLGYATAVFKGPTWVSEAVIAAKESDSQKAPNLSGLGAFGGMVASQLNIAGNPGLDKIDIILDSRNFSAKVIEKFDLLPFVYKISKPEEYEEFYDTLKNEWTENFIKPNLLKIGGLLKNEYLIKETNKNNTMTIQFKSSDSLFSDTLLGLYLTYLNDYIKMSVQTEANENVRYLENQLVTISDPLLREKIQGMIASEMEKAMLVSKEAFKIIDPKLTVKTFKLKLLLPIVCFLCFMFFSLLGIILIHSLNSEPKTKMDKKWIKLIKMELGLFKHVKKKD